MDAFVAWVQSTSLSQAIVLKTWIWPAAETVHFLGLALVIGIVGFLDLRLVGAFPRVPIAAARELVPFAAAGFVLNLTTGAIFLIGHPEQYAHNIAWWLKVGCLALAGANAAIFEWSVGPRVAALGPGDATPMVARCIGVVSLCAWLGVLYWGRMLPFVGNAF
jgi:hypothetical protein